MGEPRCPYCKHALDKIPKRKTKCPNCGEHIYVRTSPAANGMIVLVTEDGARAIDLEWHKVRSRKESLQRLAEYGMSDADFHRHKKMLSERFGQEPAGGDVIWSMFNDALERAMKTADLQQLKMLYFQMALFLYQEGRDFFHILQQSGRMELTRYKQMGFVEKVQIWTGRDASCEACRKLHGKVLRLQEALEQMPVPCKDCTFDFQGTGQPGWCRCQYLTVVG